MKKSTKKSLYQTFFDFKINKRDVKMSNLSILAKMRSGLILLVSLFAISTAWAGNTVTYLDENGDEQTVTDYTEIVAASEGSTAGVELSVKSGWYVVKGEVTYEDDFNFSEKDVYLVLTDGAKLTVKNGVLGETNFKNLTVYAQSLGENMGKFEITTEFSAVAIDEKLVVNGGAITVAGGVEAGDAVVINNGSVRITCDENNDIHCSSRSAALAATKNVTINGGSVDVKAPRKEYFGLWSQGEIFLNGGSVEAEGDSAGVMIREGLSSDSRDLGIRLAGATVKANSYAIPDKKTYSIRIENGLFYTDGEGNSYTAEKNGSINVVNFNGESVAFSLDMISGKTIHSYIPAIQFKEYEKSDGSKGVLADINANYNEIVPFGISEAKTVDSVAFTRVFTTSTTGYATVIFPFNVQANNLEGVERVVEFIGVNESSEVMMNVVWPKDKSSDITLSAHTPYMVQMYEPTLTIHGAVTLEPIKNDQYEDVKDDWKFVGTYVFKKWKAGDKELGHAYGYSAVNMGKFKAGEFGIIAENAITRAFRAYLVQIQPQAIAARKPSQSNVGAQTVLSSSYSLPDYMDVVIIDRDEDGKEHTTVIGRFNTRTGEFKLEPVGSRVYDLKGRTIRKDAKKAKGAYYGKKAVRD